MKTIMDLFRKSKVTGKAKTMKKPAAKKMIKKSVVKKSNSNAKSVKKVTRIEPVTIVDVEQENVFWVNEGGSIKNLLELHEALQGMSDDQYNFHTQRDGNDFAKWIAGAIGNKSFARKVEKTKTREEFIIVLANFLA